VETIPTPLLLDGARCPAPHGGRGALPSAGGSPSDLLFLAGGGACLALATLLPFSSS